MREEIKRWHNLSLAYHQASMFESLIHLHNITSESVKSYTFEDTEGREYPSEFRGYFAMKDVDGRKTKFFVKDEYYPQLPFKVNKTNEIYYKESSRSKSIVLEPLEITPFRIKPEKCWEENYSFLDEFAPFLHTNPDSWDVNKIVALMGDIGKTFTGICSLSEFGKSSIYLILDSITKRTPVFQPRSVPGVLAQITGNGNMVFDEVHDASSEVKQCMENFSLQVAGNSPIYINGAMKSANTKPKYDVSQQSITYLYNIYNYYTDPEKQFWNNIWINKKAMESRFLCLKFEGKLLEDFDKDFDIPRIASDNKMFYIKIAKHLLHLKNLKLSNGYQRRFKAMELGLKGRHKIVYDEITWGIDLFSKDQAQYEKRIAILNKAINDYRDMLKQPIIHESPITTIEEFVEDDKTLVERQFENQTLVHAEVLQKQLGFDDKRFEEITKKMIKEGDLYEPINGSYALLK